MKRKSIVYCFIIALLIGAYSCEDEGFNDKKWGVHKEEIKFIMEYDSLNKLKKYSKYINDTLFHYFTYVYGDTALTQYKYDNNGEKKAINVYCLNASGNTKIYYDIGSDSSFYSCKYFLYYASNGFPSRYVVGDCALLDIENDGENIISYCDFMYFVYYTFGEKLNTLSVPFPRNIDILPSFIGVFGKENKHLLSNYYQTSAGPGASISNYDFDYELDADGRVVTMKIYMKEYTRDDDEPKYGTLQYVHYEYIYD